MIIEKKCTKCGIIKNIDEYYNSKGGSYGKRGDCKICSKLKTKSWVIKNNDHVKIYYKNYRKLNHDMITERSKKYYDKNHEKCLTYGREYYKQNKDKLNVYAKEYYKLNKEKSSLYGKEWRKNNPDKWRAYSRNRYKKNLELSMIKWMRNSLYRTEKQGFNKTKMNTVMEFGYTPEQLIKRIECQFKSGMSWENRKEWHIDHIKAISNFPTGTSPKTINMLCNLRPIWAHENLSKGNKIYC